MLKLSPVKTEDGMRFELSEEPENAVFVTATSSSLIPTDNPPPENPDAGDSKANPQSESFIETIIDDFVVTYSPHVHIR